MSAFSDFIQVELPRRPYLVKDVSQNSVIVRKGSGPRQLDGVKLEPGQILMNVDGTLQAVSLKEFSGGVRSYCENIPEPSNSWTLVHSGKSQKIVVQVYDTENKCVLPDEIIIIDEDTVKVEFGSPLSGYAVVMYS
jgi:hypothetical protein